MKAGKPVMSHKIEWTPRGGPPTNPSNPAYPYGIDLDMAANARRACLVKLPYPTERRIGLLTVTCSECGLRAAISTAGRPDDPRSVKLACKKGEQS